MNNIEQILGYKYKNISYLDMALTHSSYAKENNIESYEKMEFLGDAVLEFVVTDYIYKAESINEGQSSRLRASLVSTANLSNICDALCLTRYIKLGKSLKQATTSIKEDIVESIIASIYLDGGLEKAKDFIIKHIIVSVDNVISHMMESKDYKTMLQEYIQKSGKNTIKYVELSSAGKDNDKSYTMGLYIDNVLVATATEKSKQKAEELCAKAYYNEVMK